MRQNKIKIKIKKLVTEAVIPTYSNPGDACLDITAISETIVEESGFGYIEYGTGLAFSLPENHVMLIYSRSSISNQALILANSVGVLDQGYIGELKLRFKYIKGGSKYKIGDRIGQIMVIPRPLVVFEEVEELSETSRGDGGWGSSGS